MTRKQRRFTLIIGGLAMMGIASGLVLSALQTQVTFFMSPSDVGGQAFRPGSRFRLGGLVESGTCHKLANAEVVFHVTDGVKSLPVSYKGILPDLFREKQGVVAEGYMAPDGVFVADTVLAKHDEKYIPPDVVSALKKSGRWQQMGAISTGAPCS